jgi:hypothetical protein
MKVLIPIFIFLCSSLGFAELRSVEDLKAFIHEKQISNLDQFVVNLPTDMKQNYILVYDSHALNLHLVTPETPRMMFFSRDGGLVFTLTRNPGQEAIRAGLDNKRCL